MSGGSKLARPLLMAAFGLLLGTVGADPMNMTARLTFGIMALGDGIESGAAGDRTVRHCPKCCSWPGAPRTN
jgi:TctA family transporter